MGVEAVKINGHRVGRESLDLEFTQRLAIHGVGAVSAEALNVEVLGAATHFLVRREADSHRAMGNPGVGHQVLCRRHDLGHAGLVVGAQQGGAGCRDDIVADLIGQSRIVLGPDHRRRVVRQFQVTPVVIPVKERLHILSAHFRRRVDMGNETDHRHIRFVRGGRYRGKHVTVFVHHDVGQPQFEALVAQPAQQIQLAGGARITVRFF